MWLEAASTLEKLSKENNITMKQKELLQIQHYAPNNLFKVIIERLVENTYMNTRSILFTTIIVFNY